MMRDPLPPVAALLAEAQRSAGWPAVRAAERGEYELARQWSALAVGIGTSVAAAVHLLAKP